MIRAEENVALEACCILQAWNVLALGSDELLTKAKVYQVDSRFIIIIVFDHQVLRFHIIVSSTGCMQYLESVHDILGHFKDEAHVHTWWVLHKILFNIQVKLFHDEVSCNFLVFRGFRRFIFAVVDLIEVSYDHHAVVNDSGHALVSLHFHHLLLNFDDTFYLVRKNLVLVGKLNNQISVLVVGVFAFKYFTVWSFVYLAFDLEAAGQWEALDCSEALSLGINENRLLFLFVRDHFVLKNMSNFIIIQFIGWVLLFKSRSEISYSICPKIRF